MLACAQQQSCKRMSRKAQAAAAIERLSGRATRATVATRLRMEHFLQGLRHRAESFNRFTPFDAVPTPIRHPRRPQLPHRPVGPSRRHQRSHLMSLSPRPPSRNPRFSPPLVRPPFRAMEWCRFAEIRSASTTGTRQPCRLQSMASILALMTRALIAASTSLHSHPRGSQWNRQGPSTFTWTSRRVTSS